MKTSPHPRDPDKYTFSHHLEVDVLTDDRRFIDKDMIRETIAEGREIVRSVNDSIIRRRKTYEGVDAVVVLGDRGGMCVITAWTEINTISDALQSGRWSRDEIKIIQEFEDQKDERDEYQIEL